MAGDWIKFETATPDKPEVWEIAGALGIDPDAVVGKLLRVWSWFDQHTEEGNAASVTMSLLDRSVGVSGFCAAMIDVGWMVQDGNRINLPNFDRHNGKTAKNRALTAKRVAKHKRSGNAKGNDQVTPNALPREEKRREEVKPPNSPPSGNSNANGMRTHNEGNSSSDDVIDAAFEQFWIAGMRKVGKKAARKAFAAALKRERMAPDDFAAMLQTDVFKRIQAGQMGFDSMHPTTYLNGERWNDEISTGSFARERLSPSEQVERAIAEQNRQHRGCAVGVAEDDGDVWRPMDSGAGSGATFDLDTGAWET